MERLTIDRFEGEYAVCEREDRTMVNLLNSTIPKEGDILRVISDGIYIDVDETKKRVERIKKLTEDLWD